MKKTFALMIFIAVFAGCVSAEGIIQQGTQETPVIKQAGRALHVGDASMGKPADTGAKVNTSPETAAFIDASEAGDIKEMERLLDAGADVNGKTDNKLQITPLIMACSKARVEAVKFLLDKGADVNEISRFGFTALMFAAKAGNKEVISILLKAGADPNIVGHMYATALGWAANDEIAGMLKKAGAKSAW